MATHDIFSQEYWSKANMPTSALVELMEENGLEVLPMLSMYEMGYEIGMPVGHDFYNSEGLRYVRIPSTNLENAAREFGFDSVHVDDHHWVWVNMKLARRYGINRDVGKTHQLFVDWAVTGRLRGVPTPKPWEKR